jgi:predicted MFS family arabinose efflux permease
LGALIVGVSNSFLTTYTRTINTWFSASRGLALGIAYCGAGITSIFGPRISLAVVDSYGWRAGFVFMGLATLIPLPFVYFWLQEKRFAPRQQSAPETGHGLKIALKLPAFWLIGIGCLLYFFAYNGIQFGLIPLLNEEGLSRAQAANYAGLMGIFIFLGKLLSGLTFDRFRMPYVLAVCLAADGAALIALSKIHTVSPGVALGVIGFAQGAMMSGFPYSVARYFGVRFFGSISGLISVLLSVSAFGSLLFGSLRERSGSYYLSLYVCSGILVCAAVLFVFLGTRRYFNDAAAPAIAAEPLLGEGGSEAVLSS